MGRICACVARSDHVVVLFGEMLVICQHGIIVSAAGTLSAEVDISSWSVFSGMAWFQCMIFWYRCDVPWVACGLGWPGWHLRWCLLWLFESFFTDFACLLRVSCLWRWSNLHCWPFVPGSSFRTQWYEHRCDVPGVAWVLAWSCGFMRWVVSVLVPARFQCIVGVSWSRKWSNLACWCFVVGTSLQICWGGIDAMRHGSHMCLCGQIGPCGGISQGNVGHLSARNNCFCSRNLVSGSRYF